MSKHELRAIITAILVGSADYYEIGEGAEMVADDLIKRAHKPHWWKQVWRWTETHNILGQKIKN